MAERLRPRITFANVVSCLALLIALGGASYAASRLPKNSVGAKQLKKNAVGTKQLRQNAVTAKKLKKNSVTTAKIKANAVTGAKVKGGSLSGNDLADATITGAKVAAGSLTGTNIDQSSLNSVRASNVIGISLNPDCTAPAPFPSGVSVQHSGIGCELTFGSNVLNCVATATVAVRSNAAATPGALTVFTLRKPEAPNVLYTHPYENGSPSAEPIDLTLVC